MWCFCFILFCFTQLWIRDVFWDSASLFTFSDVSHWCLWPVGFPKKQSLRWRVALGSFSGTAAGIDPGGRKGRERSMDEEREKSELHCSLHANFSWLGPSKLHHLGWGDQDILQVNWSWDVAHSLREAKKQSPRGLRTECYLLMALPAAGVKSSLLSWKALCYITVFTA